MKVTIAFEDYCLPDYFGGDSRPWVIEGNFPSRRKNPNKYFLEVANELLPEALKEAQKEQAKSFEARAFGSDSRQVAVTLDNGTQTTLIIPW